MKQSISFLLLILGITTSIQASSLPSHRMEQRLLLPNKGRIFVVSAQEAKVAQAYPSGESYACYPVWSPDSKTLAYASDRTVISTSLPFLPQGRSLSHNRELGPGDAFRVLERRPQHLFRSYHFRSGAERALPEKLHGGTLPRQCPGRPL